MTAENLNNDMAHSSQVPGNDETTISGLELFARLIGELNSSTKTNDKLQSLVDYFAIAPDRDKVWIIAVFSGRRPRRIVSSTLLRDWCSEITRYPAWLLDEC